MIGAKMLIYILNNQVLKELMFDIERQIVKDTKREREVDRYRDSISKEIQTERGGEQMNMLYYM